MKKILLLIASSLAIIATAQEVQPDSIPADTISVNSLELLPLQEGDSVITGDTIVPIVPFYELWNDSELTDIEMRTLDWSLRWLDTTDCVAVHDTTTLPDSVYKARLQALPCVIELPYNERIRAFILRYVKRSPKQVARMIFRCLRKHYAVTTCHTSLNICRLSNPR